MTDEYLQELCGKTEVTHEMLLKLLNEQAYFEQRFEGKPTDGQPSQQTPLEK